ncbi:MAG: S-layer homology domain-containing protein [Candidatus Aquicultor sp.]|nr:S-layer homology domain-containing protein [Candidatus Aquicultor sp.]
MTDIDSSWARDHIAACLRAGIVTGYPGNVFRPDKPATRAEGAVIIATQVKD